MASTDSTSKLSDVLDSLSRTLVEFRTESAEIESKFYELVDGLAELRPTTREADAARDEAAAVDTLAAETMALARLESLDRSIAEQREEFAGKQDQLTDDVGQLRELVDRQVQLFAAWINSTTNGRKSRAKGKGGGKVSSDDEVLNGVFAQFEELRGATVATGQVSKT